jgi:hypothetical protein
MEPSDYGLKEDKYEWTQTPDEVTISFKLPENIKTRYSQEH